MYDLIRGFCISLYGLFLDLVLELKTLGASHELAIWY